MIIKENKNRMDLEDWAFHLIRHKLRKDYGDNFKTSLDVVADNVLSDFLAYIEDEASGFLINEITYDDGLVKGDKLRNAVQDFVDFDLRENDINEYDVDYTVDESLDEAREMHTWSVTYNGKGNKAKTHMVDAPDAYEANRKARRELGITYTDIDDVTMVETLDEDVGKYNTDYYTADKLIDVLKSYVKMIDNDNGKHPTAVLSDIKASIKSIMKKVER